ncbi:MAG: hypothetical protein ABGW63_01530 [Flavobacteriaceae bacterium]|jgi:hypothetical protein|uniref:Membrane or secreted protein n=3 Tax=Bacteroidota TaxID=976 RepID=I3C1L5_9FLAO|nr:MULTISPECIES: hypothetical protein [Bacteroidota]MCR9228014.1 hypothetical protein [Flavobacteriaceae bacterium]ODS89457.1 MAG: hypothetical protein ABS44_04335 [Chryseobacterium sp. SCN 40-13]HNP67684.1 hypothetical protein [Aequorivita sp.]AGA79382.1 hypothetical protein Echvi_3149 [Echinicola vietnamensis DSM 17526]EIJ37508.1 hypothetical protein JoomaDRAFT_0454 [Galbibacter orientalis DSM 19592]|tara:strand:- start:1435 stop:1914 length:480 start_codon:yes stop_codon:yes gene_type:complete
MKTLLIVLSAVGLLSLNSCKQETNTQALMENPETRTEVFNAISKNHDYMTEFMESMHDNQHAMQMMQGNKKMMSSMMQGEGMQMMMKDSTMMHSMMDGMMNDGKMMGTMMKMMHEKGMMSEDCMESCSKMMGEKGMDMQGMDKMDDMDSPTKGEHTEHH